MRSQQKLSDREYATLQEMESDFVKFLKEKSYTSDSIISKPVAFIRGSDRVQADLILRNPETGEAVAAIIIREKIGIGVKGFWNYHRKAYARAYKAQKLYFYIVFRSIDFGFRILQLDGDDKWVPVKKEDFPDNESLVNLFETEIKPEIEKVISPIGTMKDDFVNLNWITQISEISNPNYDCTILIELLEELNIAYSNSLYLAVALLLRAVIDHVPPIFGKTNFSGVSGGHGGKSFRESMSHLDKSLRKIADRYIHQQIRNKENLPTRTQIDFRRDLDVLLQEIVRLNKA